jgi:hypothetical protein
MLVKLIRCYFKDYSHYANECFEPINILIGSGLSDWEEIEDKDFVWLNNWVCDFNSNQKNGYKYMILVQDNDISPNFLIKEQIKKEDALALKWKQEQEAAKLKKEKQRQEQVKRKKEKELRQLRELKKKYGEI